MSLDNLTDLENESRDTLIMLRDFMAAGRNVTRMDYLSLMTRVRNTIARLENKIYGCPTGFHVGKCSCEPAKKGKAIYDPKTRNRH